MKKIFKIFFLSILVPSISACQDTAHSIVALKTGGENYLEINCSVDQVINLIESKQQFVLECFSPTCSHCENLKPLLEKYVKNSDSIIYKLDLSTLENEEAFNEKLHDKYTDVFPNSYVPAIRFIKDGHLTYEVNSNKFSSYTALSNIMKKHFISSNFYIVDNPTDFNIYLGEHKEFVTIAYDLDNPRSLDVTAKYLLTNENAKSKKNILLVNKQGFEGSIASVLPFYSEKPETFLAYIDVSNGKMKIIDYMSADDSSIPDFISSF